ncbi:MAG: PKD domain-containing protein, partial [Paludibacter sp.]|nr:PKD domain-containing protein [Paludibacter sp.]
MKHCFLIILFLLSAKFLSAQEVNYFVSAQGNNNNTGLTTETPFASIEKVFSVLANDATAKTYTNIQINVAAGTYSCGVIRSELERAVKIKITGESAATTILQRTESGTRLFYFPEKKNDGLELIVQDLTIQNYGRTTNNYAGNVLLMNGLDLTVKVSFYHCVFKNITGCRGGIIQSSGKNNELVLEDCSVQDCSVFDYGGDQTNLEGLIHITGGDVGINNCTFENNKKDPFYNGTDRGLKKGMIITLRPTHGRIQAIIKNNTFKNNMILPDRETATSILPLISAFDSFSPKSGNKICLTEENNTFENNIRENFENDVNFYIDPEDLCSEDDDQILIRNDEGWPTVFELNKGEEFILERGGISRTIKLISFEEFYQPNYSLGDILEKAKVIVSIDGEEHTLWCRPYELPKEINGIKLYVEATYNWGHNCTYQHLNDIKRDVRFSAVLSGETWGPQLAVFPIKNYRFHSSSYNNTWNQLVPYNSLYYHRGDDFGSIPDRLDVVAIYDGYMSTIGDGTESNPFYITYQGNVKNRISHMNLYSCDPSLTLGQNVTAGQFIGKTGSTYNGNDKAQKRDPHLHISFEWGATQLSTYPTMIEAYFNTYDDDLLAIAGGYRYAKSGETIELDGNRSVARNGRNISSYSWRLHDGTVVNNMTANVRYEKAGLYSEELTVVADNGSIDKNYLQVIVGTADNQTNNTSGYLHYYPSREINPGTRVSFWSRLNTSTSINFGDGSPIESISDLASITHVYSQPGLYTVCLSGTGPNNEPATIQLRLVVESGSPTTETLSIEHKTTGSMDAEITAVLGNTDISTVSTLKITGTAGLNLADCHVIRDRF